MRGKDTDVCNIFDVKVMASRSEAGESGTNESKTEHEYFRRIMIPLMLKGLLVEMLGSEKLEHVFSKIDTSTMSLGLELLHTLFWLDLRFRDFVRKATEFSKRAWDHDYILDLLLVSLCHMYIMRRISRGERLQLERLIGDLWIRLKGGRTKMANVLRKDTFVEDLRKQARLAEAAGKVQ